MSDPYVWCWWIENALPWTAETAPQTARRGPRNSGRTLHHGLDEDEVREKAKERGCLDVLNKPVFESALVDLLDRLWSEQGPFRPGKRARPTMISGTSAF